MSPITSLQSRIGAVLPPGSRFSVHHLSSPPADCQPIFAPPADTEPEKTTFESHLLSVSVDLKEPEKRENGDEGGKEADAATTGKTEKVQVFALELIVYRTAALTTVFVSKADSTGYLSLLPSKIAPGGKRISPVKAVTRAFLSHIVHSTLRPDARLLLALFARAQGQYLFPGSIECKGKHVLDDRQLIRWWCGIMDGVLAEYDQGKDTSAGGEKKEVFYADGYIVVPGCDKYETRAFFPRVGGGALSQRWQAGDPLKKIGRDNNLPERCLVPRFPDDPKSRFVVDLDDEFPENWIDLDNREEEYEDYDDDETSPLTKGPIPDDDDDDENKEDTTEGAANGTSQEKDHAETAPEEKPKNSSSGKWRSVRTMEEFWELMAFRQECAAGRLVGFLWGVFEPTALRNKPLVPTTNDLQEAKTSEAPVTNGDGAAVKIDEAPPPGITHAPVEPVSEEAPSSGGNTEPKPPPESEAGSQATLPPVPTPAHHLVVPTEAYTRVSDLLMKLDYSTKELAVDSTQKYLEAAAKESGIEAKDWGFDVEGEEAAVTNGESAKANGTINGEKKEETNGEVAVLGAGLIRKKRKRDGEADAAAEENGENATGANGVSASDSVKTLGEGLVRKKIKSEEPPVKEQNAA